MRGLRLRERLEAMSYVNGFQCLECARTFRVGEIKYVCPECGGNLDVFEKWFLCCP